MIVANVGRKEIQLTLGIGTRTYDMVLARLRQTMEVRGHWPPSGDSLETGTE